MRSVTPAIFFDLDGTLIDSQPGILSSCRAALRALGYAQEPSLDISTIIGPPMNEVMRTLLSPYGDERVSEAVAAYREDYGRNGLFDSRPYPGIVRALSELRQSEVRLFLATSKRKEFARRILDNLQIAVFFEGIYGSEANGSLDNKSELMAYIIEKHALKSEHCLMVGDRRYDIFGAHANSMRALGVLWGYGTKDELEAAGADGIITLPEQLPACALTMVPQIKI